MYNVREIALKVKGLLPEYWHPKEHLISVHVNTDYMTLYYEYTNLGKVVFEDGVFLAKSRCINGVCIEQKFTLLDDAIEFAVTNSLK